MGEIAIKKKAITTVLSCFFVLVILMSALPFFATQTNAVMPVDIYMGKVIGKNNDVLTVQIENKLDYSNPHNWVSYSATSQWTISNSNAINEIRVGDYIEIGGLLGVDNEGESICIGKMKSSTEKIITDVYGDPGYLVPVHSFIEHPEVLNPPLLGDYIITYENIPDCSKCPSGSFGCNVEAKYSDVTISKGNEQLKSQRLYPGRSFKYEDKGRGYNIDITFNSGEAPAYPDCTDQRCLGPQAFSDFTIHIKKIEEKMPDLIIQDITWSPSNPKEGDTITFTVTVKNQGTGDAGAFYVYYYIGGSYVDYDYVSSLSADYYIGGSYVDYDYVPSLSAGSTSTQSFTWTVEVHVHVPMSARKTVSAAERKVPMVFPIVEAWIVRACADATDLVDESNEDNNCREETVEINEEKKPDLVIEDIFWEPSKPKQGDTITFTVKIKNRGYYSNAGTSTVKYYTDGSYVDSDTVPSLSVGSTSTQTFTWTANKCGDVQVKAVADALGEIEESNEENNQSTETVNVVCPKKQVHNINTGKDFSSIQAAINDSDTSPGNTITVDPGTYNENVEVTKSLTIRSTSGNPADTIVQAKTSDDHVFEITTDYVTISGFTVKGATGEFPYCDKAGIYLHHVSHCKIMNNTVLNNNGGILLESSSSNTIVNNTLSNHNWIGIFLFMSSSNNEIANNHVSDSAGICLDRSSSNTIANNTIVNDRGGIAIGYSPSNNNKIVNNTISNISPGYGMSLSSASNNEIYLNNFINNNNGMSLSSASNNKIYLNNFINNNNFHSYNSTNIWNSPEPITYTYSGNTFTNYLGNYWEEYTDTDADSDGIWDHPYSIDEDKDNYPLVWRFENYVSVEEKPEIEFIGIFDHSLSMWNGNAHGYFFSIHAAPVRQVVTCGQACIVIPLNTPDKNLAAISLFLKTLKKGDMVSIYAELKSEGTFCDLGFTSDKYFVRRESAKLDKAYINFIDSADSFYVDMKNGPLEPVTWDINYKKNLQEIFNQIAGDTAESTVINIIILAVSTRCPEAGIIITALDTGLTAVTRDSLTNTIIEAFKISDIKETIKNSNTMVGVGIDALEANGDDIKDAYENSKDSVKLLKDRQDLLRLTYDAEIGLDNEIFNYLNQSGYLLKADDYKEIQSFLSALSLQLDLDYVVTSAVLNTYEDTPVKHISEELNHDLRSHCMPIYPPFKDQMLHCFGYLNDKKDVDEYILSIPKEFTPNIEVAGDNLEVTLKQNGNVVTNQILTENRYCVLKKHASGIYTLKVSRASAGPYDLIVHRYKIGDDYYPSVEPIERIPI